MNREKIRNIAIIAHVDHGKTTLVDSLLKDSGIFRENQELKDRVMDSNALERERGITIFSKNTAVYYDDYKINIIDTPGHSDFGGEVERVLKMANGVVLLVDAFEGPMPQTKFVLSKAFELKLPVIVGLSKMDRPKIDPERVSEEILELFLELGGGYESLEYPFVYISALENKSGLTKDNLQEGMNALFQTIMDYIPAPKGEIDEEFKMLISTLDYNDYIGRIGIGRIESGEIHKNQELLLVKKDENRKFKATSIYEFKGLKRIPVESASVGDIIAFSGIDGLDIGDTITSDLLNPEALDFVEITQPTLSMVFSVNDSPFAGLEGKYVTGRHLRDRLIRETHTDVSLRVEDTEYTDSLKVSGRGELHLAVLVENMRREGYEFQISKPEVLYKRENGVLLEPIEETIIDLPTEDIGAVLEKLGKRRGILKEMTDLTGGNSRLKLEIPTRGLIGYNQEFMTDTKGLGVMNSSFLRYDKKSQDIPKRPTGSLIAHSDGETTRYGLHNAQERGMLFISPQKKVYKGMIVGHTQSGLDIDINVCREKKLSNVREKAADDALILYPPKELTIEQAMAFIEENELIEVTPKDIRLRKRKR